MKELPDNVVDSTSHLDDWRGVGYLVAIATERLTAPVEGVHRAILGRWFGIAGPKAAPAHRVVDGLTASVYQTIRGHSTQEPQRSANSGQLTSSQSDADLVSCAVVDKIEPVTR